jgi:hypothetical protein
MMREIDASIIFMSLGIDLPVFSSDSSSGEDVPDTSNRKLNIEAFTQVLDNMEPTDDHRNDDEDSIFDDEEFLQAAIRACDNCSNLESRNRRTSTSRINNRIINNPRTGTSRIPNNASRITTNNASRITITSETNTSTVENAPVASSNASTTEEQQMPSGEELAKLFHSNEAGVKWTDHEYKMSMNLQKKEG